MHHRSLVLGCPTLARAGFLWEFGGVLCICFVVVCGLFLSFNFNINALPHLASEGFTKSSSDPVTQLGGQETEAGGRTA